MHQEASGKMTEEMPAQKNSSSQSDDLRFFMMSLDMLCTASLETGHFIRLNPVWTSTLGYTLDELRAQPFVAFVHPDDQASTIQAAQALGTGKDVVQFLNRYRHKSGSYRWIEWMSAASPEERTIYAVARDITQRKETEEALLASERQKNELIAQLQQQNQQLQRQAEALRDLATPIMPLAPGVIAMPVIGNIDPQRAQQITESLLSRASSAAARVAILDITGVRDLDSHGADALLRAAHALRLLGATAVLTGIRPSIAHTLVSMGVDLAGLVTRSTLQDEIGRAHV